MTARPAGVSAAPLAPPQGALLLVSNYPSDVGYAWWLMENYWALAARAMAAQGRACHLVYPKVNGLPEVIRDAPIQVHEIAMDEHDPAANSALDALIRDARISSVYLTDRAYVARYYGRLRSLGVERIVVHDHTPGERPPIGGVKGMAKAFVNRLGHWSCDRYVATTEFIRARMISNARIAAAKTLVVPNGVVPMHEEAADRAWARAEFGVAADEIVVGLVGRANRVKGIDFALACAAAVQAAAPQLKVRFVFIGDGPELLALKERALTLGVAANFAFLGVRSDARRLMRGFDIGLHPSRAEVGYCLAILEMMDAGLPVLVPDRASVCGATTDGVDGVVYPAESVPDACAAIVRLAGDADLRCTLGQRAKSRVAADFLLERTNEVFVHSVAAFL